MRYRRHDRQGYAFGSFGNRSSKMLPGRKARRVSGDGAVAVALFETLEPRVLLSGFPTFDFNPPDGGHSASVKDRSSLYVADDAFDGVDVDVPLGALLGPSTGELQSISGLSPFSPALIGAEQRTIFSMDAVNLGIVSKSQGLVSVSDRLGTPFTNGELQGILTHLAIAAQESIGASSTNGNLYFAPNDRTLGGGVTGPRAEAAWVDTLVSPNFVGDGPGGVGGDGYLVGGLATAGAGFGGRLQLWFDPTPFNLGGATSPFDPDGGGVLLGQDQFIDGAAPGGGDLYPTISGDGDGDGAGPGNNDAILVLDAVLTPLFNYDLTPPPGVPNAADAVLLNTSFGGSGELGPVEGFGIPGHVAGDGASPGGSVDPLDAFINGTAHPIDTVLIEQINPTSGSGTGFLNIIGGDAEFISQFELDAFGPGRDIRFDFDLDVPGFGGLTTDGWQVESDDPIQFLVKDPTAMLGDRVWHDQDRDGIQDAGEPGVAGVKVILTGGGADGVIGTADDTMAMLLSSDGATDYDNDGNPDAVGFYKFNNLEPGVEYKVTFDASTLPVGFVFTDADQGGDDTIDSDADVNTGMTQIVTLAPGEFNPTLDAGIYQPTAMLGDRVWHDQDRDGIQDAGEPGVANVKVILTGGGADLVIGTADDTMAMLLSSDGATDYDNDGNPDAVGFYKFNNLEPGVEYKVTFDASTLPVGFVFTDADQGGDDTIDSDADVNTGMTQIVTLAPGEFNPTLDAGIYQPTAMLGDRVWHDQDRDGIQDAGEPGVANVKVILTGGGADLVIGTADDTMAMLLSSDGATDYDNDGNPDAVGFYKFNNLEPGVEYKVTFDASTLPVGFVFTDADQGGDDTIDSDADVNTGMTQIVTLAPGEFNPTLDAGIYQPTAMLGDLVWEDLNADGIQDNVNQPGGEPGIAGVTVKLLTDPDGDGVFDVVEQTLVTADGSAAFDYDNDGNADPVGFYKFNGLTPGVEYVVMFTNPDDLGPDAYMFSPRQAGADPTVDSDGPMSDVVVLGSGEYDPTIDAGLFRKGSIHVFGYLDVDGDGNFDSDEGAFPDDPGKTFELLDENGDVIMTDSTMDGMVWFEQLFPGTYTVRENPVPDGFALTTLPNERTFTIISGEELVYEDGAAMLPAGDQRFETNIGDELRWGNTELAMLGDFVWEDLNANGIQDPNELDDGINGVTVKLLADADGDGQVDDVVATTVTMNNPDTGLPGWYKFNGLMPGVEYAVMFTNPDDVGPDAYMFSPRQAGADPTVDSDGPMSDVVVLGSGEFNPTIDAGLFRKGSIHVFGYLDVDGDGNFDSDEGAFPDDPGKTFELLDENGDVIMTDSTMDGMVWFEQLFPGTYTVRENPVPDGFALTTLPNERTFTIISGQELVYEDGAAMLPDGDQRFETNLGDELRWGNTEEDEPAIDIEKFVKTVTDNGGGEGLTPGFWKTHSEFGPAPEAGWDDTGFDPLDDYNTVFGVADGDSPTLLEALERGGGGLSALGRHATAALLNAANPNVDYAFTEAEVIALTQAAYASGDAQLVEDTKNAFAIQNELGADLNTPAGGGGGGGDVGFGVDADLPPGIEAQLGEKVMFTYFVSNPGDVELTNVVVVDDNATPGDPGDDFNPDPVVDSGFNVGDDDTDGLLDVGEVWLYTWMITADETGQFTNIAKVTGESVTTGEMVMDDDPANYFVEEDNDPGIDLEKLTNGVDADTEADAVLIAPGDVVTWTYLVTNTGNVSFSFAEVEIVDDAGTPGDNSDDFSTASGDIVLDASSDIGGDLILSSGETWTYEASAIAEDLGSGSGDTSTFFLTGNSSTDGSDGNIRTFSTDGISVNTSAFSRDGNGNWDEAFLGAFSSGLGVTDSSEGSGSSGRHRVDNVGGRDNYVLFEFSEDVIVDQAFLDSVVNDSDITVWIGNIDGAFNSHVTLSDAVLDDLFKEENWTGSSNDRWADFNGGEVSGNVLVIAASTADSSPEDNFKLRKLKVQSVDEGCYSNMAVVSAGGVSDEDASHYCNPDEDPGIDIEKYTNGVDADTEDQAVMIAAGDIVTWTYEVTNTGNVAFDIGDVVIVDDAGTAGDSGDDFSTTSGDIVLDVSSDIGGDGILSPGEVWIYEASGVAEDLSSASSETSTFYLTGNSGTDGSNGNIRTFTADGISVNTSAFSRKSDGTWQTAFLGAYSSGLGVTDRGEGSGSSGRHRVDNVGRWNYVLFEFSETVVVDRAFLDSVVNDSDITVWIGNVDDAFSNHISLNDAILSGLAKEDNWTSSSNDRWANFNNGGMTGNVLVIAASTADSSPEDKFKIRKLKVQSTESGVYANVAAVFAGSVSDDDASHYRNPGSDSSSPYSHNNHGDNYWTEYGYDLLFG